MDRAGVTLEDRAIQVPVSDCPSETSPLLWGA